MFYCMLKGKSCPHLKKVTRTIAPKPSKRRGECLVCSKLPRTNNIVQVTKVFDGGRLFNFYHNATYCPEF